MLIDVSLPAGEAGQIWVFDGLLPEALCELFVEDMSDTYPSVSYNGMTMGGVLPDTKTSLDCFFTPSTFINAGVEWTEFYANVEHHFHQALRKAIAIVKNSRRALFSWSAVGDTGFQLQMYPQCEGYYREHVDSFPSTPTDSRVMSAIIYLNDVEYGGETAFPLHDVAIEPRAGRVVLFPSCWTHPHEGRTPISGDKWIMNTFLTNNEPHEH